LHLNYEWRRYIAYAVHQTFDQDGISDNLQKWVSNLFTDLYSVEPPVGESAVIYANIARLLPSGTNGGTNAVNAWTQYPLNTIVADESGIITLASNRFQVEAGVFDFDITVGLYSVQRARVALYNVTQATGVKAGVNVYPASVRVVGSEVSNGTDWYEVQYIATSQQADFGLGFRVNSGDDELYCDVSIYWREAE
jgi:hypothetical protein